jgi:hypothetical protein
MRNEEKVAGILGTVILHLIAAIIFMSFKIHSIGIELRKEFNVEFAPMEVPEEEKKMLELPATSIYKVLEGDEELQNIARNLANQPDPSIDAEDYIDRVKEELIKSGKLGVDNYIDEQKRLQNETDAVIQTDNDTIAENPETPDEAEKMAANYQGPTRIYYDLRGRNHTYLPIPIYKCEGSGKVVLSISVNPKGVVESAEVVESESTTTELCLMETAVQSALRSRFNADAGSPRIQTGTLTYHFVAQK